MPLTPAIILCTLNAKYIHASLGLRYLLANMARHGSRTLREQTRLREFTIARPATEIVNALLQELGPEITDRVQIVGFGVYIWNVSQTTEVIRLLREARPTLKIVLGGPEVSYEWEAQEIVRLADHVITGWGDVSFPKLCRSLLEGPPPLMKIIPGEQPALEQIELPYAEYSDDDLAHRLLYVEASRGCPFKCEFCLSALDKTAWAYEQERLLAALETLFQRGARNFKFVDRTFNLKIDSSLQILDFFLERLTPDLFLHFEVIPDHLPDRLKDAIARFPAGILQFEVGIQTFNPAVQQTISRRQDNEKTCANLHWLVNESHAHLHTDLIFGLPGETLESFAAGFDHLYALKPHEIQLGILKRLRGTPITRHTESAGMIYDSEAPYTVLQTAAVDAETMQEFKRFARYWDLIANSGRFRLTLPKLLAGPSPFAAFRQLSGWLWSSTAKTSGLTPEKLVDLLFNYCTNKLCYPVESTREILLEDYLASGARANPACLHGLLGQRDKPKEATGRTLVERQTRHTA